MSAETLNLIETLGGQIVVASITTMIAVHLALGRFRQEKWWEKKYDAYEEILRALHHMKRDFSDSYERLTESKRDRTPEQEAAFTKAFQTASADLMRHRDLGDFLLSVRAVELLAEFGRGTVEASGGAKQYWEYLDANLIVISATLDQMRTEAKRDLMGRRLTFSWLFRRGPKPWRWEPPPAS